jgi:hypothetical protein
MTNPFKSEIRAGAIHDLGSKLDDVLERARVALAQADGKNAAAQLIQQRLVTLTTNVDKDVDEGRYDLTTATLIKQYMSRAQTVAELTAAEAAAERHRATGAVAAMTTAVEITKKAFDTESALAKTMQVDEISSKAPSAPISVKQRRREEDTQAEDRHVENA